MAEIGITKESAKINQLLKKHAPNNIINSVYEFTANNTHIQYDSMKRRGAASAARWDCSELSAKTMQNFAKNMDKCEHDFKTNSKQINKIFTDYSTTASQRAELDKLHIPKVSGKSNVMKGLEVGMLIYMKYPSGGHVATVSRNPTNGELVISESNDKAGVTQRSVSSFFNSGVAAQKSTTWVRYDPFHQDRALLKSMEREANHFVSVYKEAEHVYNKQSNSPYKKVGAKTQSRDNFINDYLEENFKNSIDLNQPKNLVNSKYNNEQRVGVTPIDKLNNSNQKEQVVELFGSKSILANLSNEKPSALVNSLPKQEYDSEMLKVAQKTMENNNQQLDESLKENLRNSQKRAMGIII